MGCCRLPRRTAGSGRHQAREDLARRHEAARRAVQAVEKPLAEIAEQIVETTGQLAAIQGKIDCEALSELVSGADDCRGILREIMNDANSVIGKILGLQWFLIETGRAAQSRNDHSAATQFFRAGEALARQHKAQKPGATQLEIKAATEAWARLFEGMTK
jgi:hypothetical protein